MDEFFERRDLSAPTFRSSFLAQQFVQADAASRRGLIQAVGINPGGSIYGKY